MLMGGCFCGAVRYEAGSPYHLTNCHCTTCRRTSGAPFVTWFSVRRAEFKLLQGARWRAFDRRQTVCEVFAGGVEVT